jgi:hypothetical protein
VRHDELAGRCVVVADDLDELLRLRRFGERCEPAEIEVRDRDVRPVSDEKLCSLVTRDQLGDLRRKEPGQLSLLSLDCLEEAGGGNRDRTLVGERRHELDLVVRERPDLATRKPEDTDEVVLDEDRQPEQRLVVPALCLRVRVVGVGLDVRNVHRPLGQRDPARAAARFSRVRVRALILDRESRCPEARMQPQELAVDEPDEAAVCVPQPRCRLDDLVEDRLQPHR